MRLKLLLTGFIGVSLTTLAFAQAPGEPVFKKNCVMCHGADGAGKTKMGQKLGAADLTSSDIQGLSDEAMAQAIRSGNGKMPAFEKTLSAEEITSVVQYVRTLRK
jgi:cytochrome c6